jgi:hypothetical protein
MLRLTVLMSVITLLGGWVPSYAAESLSPAEGAVLPTICGTAHLFEGIPLLSVPERVGGKEAAIWASASNDDGIDSPWDDLKYGPLIATSVDGNLLKVLDKRPLWIVYPRDDHGALRDDIHDSRWIRPLNWLQIVPP